MQPVLVALVLQAHALDGPPAFQVVKVDLGLPCRVAGELPQIELGHVMVLDLGHPVATPLLSYILLSDEGEIQRCSAALSLRFKIIGFCCCEAESPGSAQAKQ